MDFQFPAQLAALFGALAPLIIQFIVNRVPRREVRFAIALVLSALSGVAAVWYAGAWNPADIVTSITIAFTAAQIAFNMWWKKLFDNTNLRKPAKN